VSPPQASLAAHHRGGHEIIAISGEVDHAAAADIASELVAAVGHFTSVVIDLTDVTSMDGSDLRMLEGMTTEHLEGRIDLTVVAPAGSPAGDLVRATALGQVVPIVDTLDELSADGSAP
jgi:anti-anti-sigma factor